MLSDEVTQRDLLLQALQAALEHQQIKEEAEKLSQPGSLATFIQTAWPVLKPQERYQHNWHIDVVCDHLEAVSRGEIKRLQIWLPPGMMKTGIVSIFWHAWEWTHEPWLRYWTASYETRLAGRMASASRDLMLSAWYQARWGHVFSFSREGEHYFGNNQGGTRLATAPQSTGTGEHGHRIIIDDPINAQAADATSRVVLGAANEWYDGTVTTRGIGDEHARVLVMQRLHEADLAAHLLDLEPWEVLCLPERYEAKHPFVFPGDPREEGDLLWPAYRPEALSNAYAKSLTSHRAAGQLQQRPAAREGEIIRRAWWMYYDPRIREKDKWSELGRFGMVVISVDTPLKDKDSSDNVAAQCWGIKGADNYLLDIRLGKMNYGLCKRTVREMSVWARRIWPSVPHYILIENAGYGVELIVDLKRELSGVVKITPGIEGAKELRAESATDALESGNYFVPGYGPPQHPAFEEAKSPADVVAFIDNCARFPNGMHDDDVDAWSQFGNWRRSKTTSPLRTSSAHRRRPLPGR